MTFSYIGDDEKLLGFPLRSQMGSDNYDDAVHHYNQDCANSFNLE
jgi:hypothetical protein